ncbi:transcriptional regulator, AraC family [Caldicellulosiruptor hydrothermalis 108]|uniref:Transcriptional regulator, AraC family n=1 Tax=Caldicellulosiruptor hydrothermalis (strain DSM 18901 / VKM B-2411 / 108) TaxID=632292 RepID=E4Q8S5_CALH1|nr:transcriptional regulator, AraC family [Caldicellulosiruptor hydrothermalis 108]
MTFGDVQTYLTSYFFSTGKKKTFLDAIFELYKSHKYLVDKPVLPQQFLWSNMSDEEFIDALNLLPIRINDFIETKYSSNIREHTIFPDKRDIFVFKNFNFALDFVHSHDYFEVIYVFRGSCIFQFEKEHQILIEGNICIVAPESLHNIIVEENNSVVIIIAIRKSTFDTAFFAFLSQKDVLSYFFRTILYNKATPNYLLFETDNSNDIKFIIKNLTMENYRDDKYKNDCCISWANILFSYLLRVYSNKVKSNNFISDDNFSPIIEFIQHNYKNITLKDIANQFHYSESYLSALIKNKLGINFTSLITKLKMADAKDYLENTDLPLEKIAEYVGYNSVDHFSRTFKKFFKQSPHQYRKSIKNRDALKN